MEEEDTTLLTQLHTALAFSTSRRIILKILGSLGILLLVLLTGCGGDLGSDAQQGNGAVDNDSVANNGTEDGVAGTDIVTPTLTTLSTHRPVSSRNESWIPEHPAMANYGSMAYFGNGPFSFNRFFRLVSFYNPTSEALAIWTHDITQDPIYRDTAASSKAGIGAFLYQIQQSDGTMMRRYSRLMVFDFTSSTPRHPTYTNFPLDVNNPKVLVSANGRYVYTIMSASAGLEVKKFDLQNLAPGAALTPAAQATGQTFGAIRKVDLSDDGNSLLVTTGGNMLIFNTNTMVLRPGGNIWLWADSLCSAMGDNFVVVTERNNNNENAKVWRMDAAGGFAATANFNLAIDPNTATYGPAYCDYMDAEKDKFAFTYKYTPNFKRVGASLFQVPQSGGSVIAIANFTSDAAPSFYTQWPSAIVLRNGKAFMGVRSAVPNGPKLYAIYQADNANTQVQALLSDKAVADDGLDIDPNGERFIVGLATAIQVPPSPGIATTSGVYEMGSIGNNGFVLNALPVANSALTMTATMPANMQATVMQDNQVSAQPIERSFGTDYLTATRTATALGSVPADGRVSYDIVVPALGQCRFAQMFTSGTRRWSQLLPLCGFPVPQP